MSKKQMKKTIEACFMFGLTLTLTHKIDMYDENCLPYFSLCVYTYVCTYVWRMTNEIDSNIFVFILCHKVKCYSRIQTHFIPYLARLTFFPIKNKLYIMIFHNQLWITNLPYILTVWASSRRYGTIPR